MRSLNSTHLRLRVKDRITTWRVAVEHMAETESSVLAFGRRGDRPVVVKVVKHPGDEWSSGAVLQVFDGSGTVRVFEYVEGALLLERLSPGPASIRYYVEVLGFKLDWSWGDGEEFASDARVTWLCRVVPGVWRFQ